MASVTGLFRRGASYYLKVVLPLDHPARAQYRSGRQVVSLGACSFREAVGHATQRRALILYPTAITTDTAPAAATTGAAAGPPAGMLTLRAVYRRWIKSKATRSTDSIAACGRALNLFEEFTGKLTLDWITRDVGDGFRAWLQEPERGTTSKTARDRFTWVKSLLKYAHRDLGLLPASPWAGLDIEARTTGKRRPWTAGELTILFSQSLHTVYALPAAWNAGADAAYWLPLLGLYTGARLSELAQLTPADVQQDGAIHLLDLNDDTPDKRIKTDAGRRRVPLHPELIRLGFLRYVASVEGEESLWPKLPKREGKPGGFFSAWFGTYRRGLGLGARPDFHCLRHNVRTALARAGVRGDVIDAIVGHEPGGSEGNRIYTHRELPDLFAAVQSLPACATSHLPSMN